MSDNKAASNQNTVRLIDASLIDPKLLVLNHGDTFACFNRSGDIIPITSQTYGLFHKGCRHLSQLEIKVFDVRPHYLSSTVYEDNCLLNADLTNPNFYYRQHHLQPGMIHIKRKKFILDNRLCGRISITNFSRETLQMPMILQIAADFKDIFEIRGFNRQAGAGEIDIQHPNNSTIAINYHGKDDQLRCTKIIFSRPFRRDENGDYCFILKLAPEKKEVVEFTIDLRSRHRKLAPFKKTLTALEQEIKNKKFDMCDIISSNEQFNHWINRSRADLAALLSPQAEGGHYPMAGIPWYNTIFGRDGIVTSVQTLMIAPHIARDVLFYLAKNQATKRDDKMDAEVGKILHEIRESELVNLGEVPFQRYYGSVDATPLFVCLAGLYFRRTNDLDTIKAIWPNIKLALKWVDHYGDCDGDGFIEYQKKCPKGLDNQGWKDSHDSVSHSDGKLAKPPIALCEVQGYVYQAKISASKIALALDEERYAKQLSKEAATLKIKFNEKFWSKEHGFYALALDGDKKRCNVISSNVGHCLANSIIDKERVDDVVKKLFSDDLFSGWGIRTLSKFEKRYNPMSYHNGSIWPHDNSVIALGLSRHGYMNEVETLTKALFDASLTMEMQRMPELFCGFGRQPNEAPTLYPVACSPQAWASGSLFLLLQSICGIDIAAHKQQIILHQPALPDFLNELTFKDIWMEPEKQLSFRLVRYQHGVVVEVIHKPEGWTLNVIK